MLSCLPRVSLACTRGDSSPTSAARNCPGWDAFHRVPFSAGEVTDAVERVPTIEGRAPAWESKTVAEAPPSPCPVLTARVGWLFQ
jgi:hypothetical protein